MNSKRRIRAYWPHMRHPNNSGTSIPSTTSAPWSFLDAALRSESHTQIFWRFNILFIFSISFTLLLSQVRRLKGIFLFPWNPFNENHNYEQILEKKIPFVKSLVCYIVALLIWIINKIYIFLSRIIVPLIIW